MILVGEKDQRRKKANLSFYVLYVGVLIKEYKRFIKNLLREIKTNKYFFCHVGHFINNNRLIKDQ